MKLKFQLFLISCTLVLSACHQATPPSGLVYCSEGNPETFNPQLVTSGTTIDATSHQIYNRLVNYSPDALDIEPSLATEWHISDDGLVYHFTLRQNVEFHHTPYFTPSRTFNADDVLFSFQRIIDSNHPFHQISKTGYPFFQSIGFDKLIKRIEKTDTYEVTFYLNRPDAAFLSNLATDFAVILSSEYAFNLQQKGQAQLLDVQPVGTGPFQLVQYIKNEYIRYKRHPHYWQSYHQIDNLIFDITTRSTARIAKVITGDCSISALPKVGELAVVADHKHISVDAKPGLNVAFWALNTQKPPLNDIRVRRALAHAIDTQNILNVVYHEIGEPATGVLPPSSWAYTQNLTANEYNPEKARQLLDEAKINSLSLDIWAMPVARIYNPNALKTAELIQADLAAIGVKANIITYDWSIFTQKLASNDYDSVLIGWNADNSDPDNFFTPLLSCSALKVNNNRSKWCNKDFDHLLVEAQSTTDKQKRKSYYQAAEAIISDQVPLIPLAHAQKVMLKRNNIQSMQIRPYGGIALSKVKLTSQEKND